MANLILNPEEDDPQEDDSDFSTGRKSGYGSPAKLKPFLPFNPDAAGFEVISPWPSLEPMRDISGNGIKLTDKSLNKKERQ